MDQSPPIGVDLNGAPFLIAKVEVDFTPELSHADVNVSFGPVELGLSFELLQRAIEFSRAWRFDPILIEATPEKITKALGANWPGFTVSIVLDIGVGDTLGRVEQRGILLVERDFRQWRHCKL
jgi:hypothetical protein